MHQVMTKFDQFNSFSGEFPVLGSAKMVEFIKQAPQGAPDDGAGSVFIIRGLGLLDVMAVLELVSGKSIVHVEHPIDKPGKPTVQVLKELDEAQAAKKEIAKGKEAAKQEAEVGKALEASVAKTANGTQAVTTTTLRAVPAVPDGPTEDWHGIDVAQMAKMTKLREAIDYIISRGHKTASAIVKVGLDIKGQVPAFLELEKKALAMGTTFEVRLDRAATTMVSEQPAS